MLGPHVVRLGRAAGPLLVLSGLGLTGPVAQAIPPAAPELSVSGDPGAGHLTLTWSPVHPDGAGTGEAASPETTADAPLGPGSVFELVESEQADFGTTRERYRGRDRGTVLSGLSDGARHYRVRVMGPEGTSAWSQPVRFEVAHHAFDFALKLLALGGLVFFALVAYLIVATRRLAGEQARA